MKVNGLTGWRDICKELGGQRKAILALNQYVELGTCIPNTEDWDWDDIMMNYYSPERHLVFILLALLEKLP